MIESLSRKMGYQPKCKHGHLYILFKVMGLGRLLLEARAGFQTFGVSFTHICLTCFALFIGAGVKIRRRSQQNGLSG